MNRDELATARWFKSSRSNGQNNCVEVSFLDSQSVALRDSKCNGNGPVMVFAPAAWRGFIHRIEGGTFNGS